MSVKSMTPVKVHFSGKAIKSGFNKLSPHMLIYRTKQINKKWYERWDHGEKVIKYNLGKKSNVQHLTESEHKYQIK